MSSHTFLSVFRSRGLKQAAAGVVVAAVAWGGGSYWFGLKTEQTLAEQYRLLQSVPLFVVKSHSYQRGWFSSTETTELTFNKKLFTPYLSMLPANAAEWLDTTVRYTNHIKHGPLPEIGDFGFRPGRAVVTTEFAMSEQTRKTLQKFFGDKPPITVINRLNFGGGGTLTASIPKFDYEEPLAGVKVDWKGLDTRIDYEPGYKEYAVDVKVPGLNVEAATKGRVALDGVHYQSSHRPGQTGVTLGSSEMSVVKVSLDAKESLPYEIKLNELVYLLTRMRVGEFINPVGEIKPSRAVLDQLRYQIVTSEQDDFVNTRGKLSFAHLSVDQSSYGPMRLDVSANHLHGPTLVRLDQALSAIPFEGVEPAALRQQYIDTIKKNGLPLLTNNPKLLVNDFYLKLPAGEVKASGDLALNNLREADLNKPADFLAKVEANASIEVPKQTLESMVVAQARNLFVVDETAENPPSVDEIDDLARNLLASQLEIWQEGHYLTIQNGQVRTRMNWKDGKMSISGKPVSMPWQEAPPAPEPEPAPPPAAAARP